MLNLTKWAMMLPPPTAAAKALGRQAGKKGVMTSESALAQGLAAKETTPVMQHIKAMGPPGAGETATSQWFRGELLGQASPQQLLAGSGLGQASQGASSALGTTATMAPPRRALQATMRPARP